MKKLLMLSSLVIFCLVSCKKDSNTTTNDSLAVNSIEFYVDGAKQVYGSAYATNGIGSMTGLHLLTVGSNQMFPNTIQVKVFDSLPITTKTYVSTSGAIDSYTYTFYGGYQTRQLYPNGFVKVTSISSTNVQGEFMDSVYQTTNMSWKVLKNGRFNVNF